MSAVANRFRVFVYGTLKKGEPNHHVISSVENGFSQFLGSGTTAVKFPLVIGTRYNIPFLLRVPGSGNHIKGEVYEVDEKMMAHLDVLEDYPAFYDREVNEILMEPGSNVEKMNCWIYMMRNFPEKMLCFPTLTEYRNSEEKPYRESYLDSCTPEELFKS